MCGDNAVGAFAGFDVIHQEIFVVNEPGAFYPITIFREEPGEEQGQVPNVTMNVSFFFGRGLLAMGFGCVQKFRHGLDRFSLVIFDAGELVNMDKFEEQVRNIFGHLEIRPSQCFGKVSFGQPAK